MVDVDARDGEQSLHYLGVTPTRRPEQGSHTNEVTLQENQRGGIRMNGWLHI